MTSLSVDREREHAKPIEEAGRALEDAGIEWIFENLSTGITFADVPNEVLAKACWDTWKAHGWITDLGLEAMKKERGME